MAAVLTLQCQTIGWTLCAGGGEGLNVGSADPAVSGRRLDTLCWGWGGTVMAAVLTLQCQTIGWTLCAGGGEGLNGGSADPAVSDHRLDTLCWGWGGTEWRQC